MSLMDTMAGLSRSHYCAAVTEEDQGKEVVLCGWVERRRDQIGRASCRERVLRLV